MIAGENRGMILLTLISREEEKKRLHCNKILFREGNGHYIIKRHNQRFPNRIVENE